MNPRTPDRVALAVALGALLVLGLRPTSVRSVDAGLAVLRTPGATLAEARAVAESIGGARVIDLAAGERPGNEARLHLVGWGLDEGELRRWGDRDLIFHTRPIPAGVRSARWPGTVSLGSAVTVQVDARGLTGEWLVLEGEDGRADSVAMAGRNSVHATLRHTPRATGSALYRLRLGDAVDSFSVLVGPPSLPSALILASAPSREWSDLRDWLAHQGGSVTFRTTVAKGKTRVERINEQVRNGDPVDRRELAATGVVITDARTLATLPRAERQALNAAVTEGMGMIVVVEDEGSPSDPVTPWRLTAVADLTERQVRPRVDGRAISPTPVAAAGSVMAAGPFGSAPLLDDGQGGVLAMATTLGRGRVAGTVVNGAGRWLRGGEPEAFAEYWHTLVDATARRDAAEPAWELPDGPVLLDGETILARRGGGVERWMVGDDTLQSTADPLGPTLRVAHWWPRSAGWNALEGARLFVAGASSWRTWQAAERTRLTQRAIARHRAEAMPGERVPVRTPWPLLPFFLLFIAAAALLWRRVR